MDINSFLELHKQPLIDELKPFVRQGEFFTMLHHPLVVQVPFDPEFAGHANMLYKHKVKAIEKALEEKHYHHYVFLHERPYRLDALRNLIAENIPAKDYWNLVGSVWVDSENIHENLEIWREIWARPDIDRRYIMDDRELEVYNLMPDTVMVYRGASHPDVKDGMSWTLSRNKAAWFANRFNAKGPAYIASGKIKREKLLAYFNGRSEREVVLFPENIEKITVSVK